MEYFYTIETRAIAQHGGLEGVWRRVKEWREFENESDRIFRFFFFWLKIRLKTKNPAQKNLGLL